MHLKRPVFVFWDTAGMKSEREAAKGRWVSLSRALGGTRLALAPQGGEEKGPASPAPWAFTHGTWLVSCIPDRGHFIDKDIPLFTDGVSSRRSPLLMWLR